MPSAQAARRKARARPHVDEPADQRIDVVSVQWRGGQAQAFGATRHGRVVDRLDHNAVAVQGSSQTALHSPV